MAAAEVGPGGGQVGPGGGEVHGGTGTNLIPVKMAIYKQRRK